MNGMATLGRGQTFPLQNYKKGAKVWVRDNEAIWIGATLQHDFTFETRKVRLTIDEDDRTIEFDINSLEQLPFLRNPSILVGKDDLTALSYLHEPAVLHNLRFRFVERETIYTYCGIVLVAINPYSDCPHLYADHVIQVYRGVGKSVRELDPHIFAVAEEAFYDMAEFSKSQSIIVSGESGAGKTMSAKFVMRYLASVAGSSRSEKGVEQKVLASNPIMESIGNAKTLRNDNSSRFGKFIQINFCDRGAKIRGAIMKTYLLEKSRLVFQAPGERNYHVFYQMCAARGHPMLKAFHIGSCETYHYLSQGGDSRIPGVDDRVDFEALIKAFEQLGIMETQCADIFQVLTGVLVFGNIVFDQGEGTSAISSSSSSDIVKLCNTLWKVKEDDLRTWLTRREIRAVNEVVNKALTKSEAIRSRDALTKMIYAHLFNWLVDRVNQALGGTVTTNVAVKRVQTFIGVLDIYGFETFEVNSFEQFCINYANEKLQQLFNQHVFKLEQEEYVREEIDWVRVDFHDNQPAIDLIEGQMGIVSLLDEQCKRLNGTDKDWLSQLTNSAELKKNAHFALPRVRSDDFIVKHFAADVTYSVDGFVEKNRDAVSDQLLDVICNSEFDFLKEIVLAGAPQESKAPSGRKPTKKTVASQFRDSLKELVVVLGSTRPHYVRCIKPNDIKMRFEFDPKRAIQQLRACGVLETVRISAAGFPSRYAYEEFAKRYRILYTKEKALWRSAQRQFAQKTCEKYLDEDKYALGKTKVFLRTGQVAVLERMRLETLSTAATKIQSTWKGYVARKKYQTMKNSLKIVQAAGRAFLAFRRVKYLQMHRAAIVIQTAYRRHAKEKKYNQLKAAVLAIQSHYRGEKARNYVKKIRYEKSVLKIQSAWRGYLVRREQIERRKKIVMVQCCVRKWLAKRRLRELKIEARSVGHLQKLNTGLENKIIELQMKLDVVTKRAREDSELSATRAKELKKTKDELEMMAEERLTLLEARNRAEVLQGEMEKLETLCDVKEAEKTALQSQLLELNSKIGLMNIEVQEANKKLDCQKKQTEELQQANRKLQAELEQERTIRGVLEAETNAMREQLMKNVDLFESNAFAPPVKLERSESPSLSSDSGLSYSTSTHKAVSQTVSQKTSADSHLDDVALIIRQQSVINEMRRKAEQCQRETARMKAILDASSLIESLDRSTSLQAFETNKLQDLENAYARLKQDLDRITHEKITYGLEEANLKAIFERIFEENERYREESAELRAMLSSHLDRASVAGGSTAQPPQQRRSPRPDSGHCSGADSEDGSSGADLEEELCVERQFRHLKMLAEHLARMLASKNMELERLEKQQYLDTQINFRPSDCSMDEAVRKMRKDVQLLANENMDLNEKVLRQADELAEAHAQLRGYGGRSSDLATNQSEIVRLEAFNNDEQQHEGYLEVFNAPEFSRILVCELRPRLAYRLTTNLPAYLVFAAFRFHDERKDEASLTGFFSSFHIMLKDTISRTHDLDLLSLWLVNTWRLFNLLRQYAAEDARPEWLAANTEQQNRWRLKSYDMTPIREHIQLRVEESYANLMKKAIKHLLMPKIVPGLLEHESSSMVMLTAATNGRKEEQGEQKKGLDDLLQFMDGIHSKLTTYGADDFVINQVMGRMVEWMCTAALNHLVFRKELCNFEKAIQIKHNVTEVQGWLDKKSLGAHKETLEPLVQACHLLQSRKDIETICGELTDKLRPAQVISILQHYDPSEDVDETITMEFLIAARRKLDERARSSGTSPSDEKDALETNGTYLPPFDTSSVSYSDFDFGSLTIPSCLQLQNICRLV